MILKTITIKTRYSRKELLELMSVFFYTLCIYNPSGMVSVPGYITRSIFLAVGVWALYSLFKGTNAIEKSFFKKCVFGLVLLPDIVLFVYSSIITLLEKSEYPILHSTMSLFIGRILVVLFIWAGVKKFGYKAINCYFWGCAVSYSYTLINYFREYGLAQGLAQATIGSYGLSIEVHNMTYIFGYLFLYFLLMAPKPDGARKLKAILCLIFVYFGQKRLIFLSLIIALLFWLLLLKLKKVEKMKVIRFGCIALLVISLGYIWAIHSGLFQTIILLLEIQTSSRLRFYMYFVDQFDFSLLYFGRGITYTDEVMASVQGIRDLNLMQATTLHNDMLRLFIAVGTIPFILYIFNIAYVRVKWLQKHFQEKTSFFYFILSIAYFVNWFASNAGIEMWCYSGYIFCMITLLHYERIENQ